MISKVGGAASRLCLEVAQGGAEVGSLSRSKKHGVNWMERRIVESKELKVDYLRPHNRYMSCDGISGVRLVRNSYGVLLELQLNVCQDFWRWKNIKV